METLLPMIPPHPHHVIHPTHTPPTPPTHTPPTHRYSLSGEVINFIHKTGCVMFSVRNIKGCAETQPPLEVVEMFSTLFCCLKDSADFSQVMTMEVCKCVSKPLLQCN